MTGPEGMLLPGVVVGVEVVVVLLSPHENSGLPILLPSQSFKPLLRTATSVSCTSAQRKPIVSANTIKRVSGRILKTVGALLQLSDEA